jgi:cell division protein FtsB
MKKDEFNSNFLDRVKEKGKSEKKTIKKILFLLIAVFVVYSFFSGPYGFLKIFSLIKEKKDLQIESKRLSAELMDLENKKEKLKSDTSFLEKQARERLGMAKENEKIYKFVIDTTRKVSEENPKKKMNEHR